MKRMILTGLMPALLGGLFAFAAAQAEAAPADTAARVAADLEGRQITAPFFHYAVPPLSELKRLPGTYPADGLPGGPLRIVAAGDEYEAASFVLYPFQSLDRVELAASPLAGPGGAVLPAAALDLKVVKVWFQNGNAWNSYFADVGLVPVPELLLNDEALIKVDAAATANYARVRSAGGDAWTWISPPRRLDTGFDPYTEGFADADTLQPVTLAAGEFKQFFLTVHVPKGAKPGLYTGQVTLSRAGKPLAAIPVSLRVLPFDLPLPKTRFDPDRDFVVSLMGAWPRLRPDHPALLPTLKNLRRHNLLHLGPEVRFDAPQERIAKHVALMKEAGFQTRPIISGNLPWVGQHDGTPLTFDELMTIKRSAQQWAAFYSNHFGHTEAAIGLGDEQGAAWVAKTRPAWRIVNQEGLKTALAGHGHIFVKGGHMLDYHPTAGSPDEKAKTETWNTVGHAYVGFYASQHNGSENPAYVRRQHGLLGYLSNFGMVDNYEFAYGPWNDLAYDLYKPMVLAYPTSRGLVDTLEWEGFREGIDDIRYATLLNRLALEARASKDWDRIYAGRRALQWFALMDGTRVDLDAARLEMIEKILELAKLADAAQ